MTAKWIFSWTEQRVVSGGGTNLSNSSNTTQVSAVSVLLSLFMESSRPRRKVYPQCDTALHAKRLGPFADAGIPKRKAQCTAKKEATKRRRIVESQQEKWINWSVRTQRVTGFR